MYELLIVDDEMNSRDILASCFPWEEEDFHVCHVCCDGREAFDYICHNTVHVVLTDIAMPNMDGIELAQQLHESKPSVVVIFLSAYNNFQYAQSGMKYGVRYYLLKPTGFSELREVFGVVHQELDSRFRISKQPQTVDDSMLNALTSYCKHHFKDGSLSEFAAGQFLTSPYVSQLIRQKSGRNFSDFLTQARMEEAAILLADPDAKIYQISEAVGYINPNNFARAFKTYYGQTPSEFKEQQLNPII